MLIRLVVGIFGLIQTLLGVRMILPILPVPEQFQGFVPALIEITDLLMLPFRGFQAPDAGGFPGFGGGQLDLTVLPALIGWSIIELVVVGVLTLLGGRRSRDRGDGELSA